MRKLLDFFPEDQGPRMAHARHGKKWLKEVCPTLLTPMIRIGVRDYYIFEPTLLSDGRLCIPHRLYMADGKMVSSAWLLVPATSPTGTKGWEVDMTASFIIPTALFIAPFPTLVSTFISRKLADPRLIFGMLNLYTFSQ